VIFVLMAITTFLIGVGGYILNWQILKHTSRFGWLVYACAAVAGIVVFGLLSRIARLSEPTAILAWLVIGNVCIVLGARVANYVAFRHLHLTLPRPVAIPSDSQKVLTRDGPATEDRKS
jgi:predicted membrane channel-forming protein YqfA (hemolysin III family)